jgi:hypothetical protein
MPALLILIGGIYMSLVSNLFSKFNNIFSNLYYGIPGCDTINLIDVYNIPSKMVYRTKVVGLTSTSDSYEGNSPIKNIQYELSENGLLISYKAELMDSSIQKGNVMSSNLPNPSYIFDMAGIASNINKHEQSDIKIVELKVTYDLSFFEKTEETNSDMKQVSVHQPLDDIQSSSFIMSDEKEVPLTLGLLAEHAELFQIEVQCGSLDGRCFPSDEKCCTLNDQIFYNKIQHVLNNHDCLEEVSGQHHEL